LSYNGLHFLRSDRKLYYSYSANPFPESELPAVEDEARNFAEDMGAMLDELSLAKMSDVEKDRWIDEQYVLSSKKQADEQPATADVAQPQQGEPAPAVQPVPAPVQPAPAPQPAPAVLSPPPEPILPAPVPRPEPIVQTMPEPGPAPAEQVQDESPRQASVPSRPQRKQAAAPRQPPDRPKTAAPVSDPQLSLDDVMEQGVKDGIVKAPKQPLKKDIRSSSGVTSRDKEALARLLASF
jgi:outer membrane biosynthesis protein TonB